MSTETPQHANENGTTQQRLSGRALALLRQFTAKADAARQREWDYLKNGNDLPWDDTLSLWFSPDELEQFRGDLERLACELRDAGGGA
jgi:hypothetical protein